ncbi:MAG: hypothetical protein AB1806_11805 [Acidobacteriota bacterium]
MFILAVALVVLVVLWFVFKPAWAPKPPDATDWAGKATQASKQATAKAGEMYNGLRGRLKFRQDTRELAGQFRQWVAGSGLADRKPLYEGLPDSAAAFASWLGGLSTEELEDFTQGVARFCGQLNFDIAWLTNTQLAREPELKQTVEDATLLYSLAAWRAGRVQQQVRNFLAYQDWLAQPERHTAFGQRLYRALLDAKLVTAPAELYLAPEKERLTQAVAAIRTVADDDPATFRAVLHQLGASVAPKPAPAPPDPEPEAPTPEAPETDTSKSAAPEAETSKSAASKTAARKAAGPRE